jgi:arylsulfatase A-like enzyme
MAVLLAGLMVASAANADNAPPPHIIIIYADDMGLGDLGCYGGKLAPTPRIDRLADEGVRFLQYYSASPICSPSRAGLITGMFPARWRITSFLQTRSGNRGCEQADFLDPQAPVLPRLLRQAGYATAHFGKWHLGGGRDVTDAPPFAAYGYDEHAGTYESPQPHPDITATNWIWSDQDPVKRWDRTAFFVDKTLDFLARHAEQPCFVNLWLDDIHTPWVPEAGAPKGDTRRNLRPVLVELDRQMGRLLDGLQEKNLTERTLVIFTSDNGPLPTFEQTRTAGLRGSKLSLYEGGVRMPFLVRWPGRIPAGRTDEATVLSAVDLAPSLITLAGAALPRDVNFDGEDLSAALLGKLQQRQKPLFWEYGRNEEFFRFPGDARNRSPNLAVRDGSWKLLVSTEGANPELYDLQADPNETKNLADAQPQVVNRLRDAALAWWATIPQAKTSK